MAFGYVTPFNLRSLPLTSRRLVSILLALNVAFAQAFWNRTSLEQYEDVQLNLDSAVPLPCHSHNDYLQKKPLYGALQAGCISVEADVWVDRGHLSVAHTRERVKPGRNLSSMYLDPLVEILEKQNPSLKTSSSPRGVYSQDPEQTFILLVDIKQKDPSLLDFITQEQTDPKEAWPILLAELKPLHEKGLLSYYNDGKFVSRPITVVASGMATLELVKHTPEPRYVFLDAPLKSLRSGKYDQSNSYLASASFAREIGTVRNPRKPPSAEQLKKMRRQVEEAHRHGLKVRYFKAPVPSERTKFLLWNTMLDQGVDLLNTDDVKGASQLKKFMSQ